MNKKSKLDLSEQSVKAQLLALVNQTQYTLEILTETLEPGLLNQNDVIEAIRQIAVRSQYSSIRFLTRDSQSHIRDHSALIALVQQLPSIISARIPPEAYCQNHSFIIGDRKNFLQLPSPGQRESALFLDRAVVCQKPYEKFQECWDKGTEDHNLRRLSL